MGSGNPPDKLVAGIFVGGRSRRMGGFPKGLLQAPDGSGTLVERLRRVVLSVFPESEVVLLGEATAYSSIQCRVLPDDPQGSGPLGGMNSLLEHARNLGAPRALALACDLPFVSDRIVRRISLEAPEASAVVPRCDGILQPLCAAYAPGPALLALEEELRVGRGAVMGMVHRLGGNLRVLDLASREFQDWDRPEDLPSS